MKKVKFPSSRDIATKTTITHALAVIAGMGADSFTNIGQYIREILTLLGG